MKLASLDDTVNYSGADVAAMAGQKMKCVICGWVYDPAIGIPGKGVKPGTPLEELPAEFRCPKCGAVKKWFQPVA